MAIDAVVSVLEDAGIEAGRDPGAFYPQPIGVLVGLPSLVRATLGEKIYELPVYVVSGDPLSTPAPVDRLYALADEVASVLAIDSYRPSDWRGSANAEPLPAVELTAIASVPYSAPIRQEGSPDGND